MAEFILGTFASGIIKSVGDKVSKAAFTELGRIYGVNDELRRLNNTFATINAVIHDADQQPITLRSEKNWIQSLTDVAYDIDDVLDKVSSQDLEDKARGRRLGYLRQKIRITLLPRYSLAKTLKSICNRLDEIVANQSFINTFQQCPRSLPSTVDTNKSREIETDPFVQEIDVVGRNEDRDGIITRLISSSSQEIQVLPIVGLGGMGKTTLAKLVFNDPRIQAVKQNFELQMWAFTPREFDIRAVIENILQSAIGKGFSHLNTGEMKKKLRTTLVNKTFFLVLDNMWVKDVMQWSELKELLEVGSKRSRVIVTTREDRVASISGTMEAYKLDPLSYDHCSSIFVKYAFRGGEETTCPELMEIGKDLVRKCCGVPLAAKTLGSQLRTDRDESNWKRIKDSQLWEIEQNPGGILPALKVSYNQLPHHLRLLFSLCSLVWKGRFFEGEWIIILWMALGPLESRMTNEALEDIGSRYVNELVSRSIFQPVHRFDRLLQLRAWLQNISETDMITKMMTSTQELQREPSYGKVEAVQVHDLMHDLAMSVVEEVAFLRCDRPDVSARAKYLMWEDEDLSERQFPPQLLAAKKARSLLIYGKQPRSLSKSFLHCLISTFKRLRVLLLSDYQFENLPNSIGDLKHLRCLYLTGNCQLQGLPDSICKLVNLQTLDVIECEQLERFPKDLHSLVSLRRLFFTSKLHTFPKTGFHGWTSLQKIKIAYCKQLTSLPVEIGCLATLRTLRINTCINLASLPNGIRHLTALEDLQILVCEKLDLVGWEGLHGLRSLRHLEFSRLPLLVHFPDGLQRVNGSLRYLVVKDCPNLIALPESLERCTFLLKLTLFECFSLSALPKGIQAMKSLQGLWIAYCPKLDPRCAKETGEDWPLISHIPNIVILP